MKFKYTFHENRQQNKNIAWKSVRGLQERIGRPWTGTARKEERWCWLPSST